MTVGSRPVSPRRISTNRRLAAPLGTEQAEHLARATSKADTPRTRLVLAVALVEIADLDSRARATPAPASPPRPALAHRPPACPFPLPVSLMATAVGRGSAPRQWRASSNAPSTDVTQCARSGPTHLCAITGTKRHPARSGRRRVHRFRRVSVLDDRRLAVLVAEHAIPAVANRQTACPPRRPYSSTKRAASTRRGAVGEHDDVRGHPVPGRPPSCASTRSARAPTLRGRTRRRAPSRQTLHPGRDS